MNKILSLMGLCRRAGKLSAGHDMVMQSVRNEKAQAVILTSDASPRHRRELEAADFKKPVIALDCDMNAAGAATGKRSCIFSVEDSGFARQIQKIYEGGLVADGSKIQDT